MRDEERRTPEPCTCGDPACPWCGNGYSDGSEGDTRLCGDCDYAIAAEDDHDFAFTCEAYGEPLSLYGNALYRCEACRKACWDAKKLSGAGTARPWCGDGGVDIHAAARDEWIAIVPLKRRGSVVATLAYDRHVKGARQYGDAWKRRDNLTECLHELADAFNYIAYAHATGYVATDDVNKFTDSLILLSDRLSAMRRATRDLVTNIAQAHSEALAEKEARDGDHS